MAALSVSTTPGLRSTDQETATFRSEPAVRFNQHGGKELRGALAYPGNGEDLVARQKWNDFRRLVLFAHTGCEPYFGYNFPFGRLSDLDWGKHLKEKSWWCGAIAEALEIARKAISVPARGKS